MHDTTMAVSNRRDAVRRRDALASIAHADAFLFMYYLAFGVYNTFNLLESLNTETLLGIPLGTAFTCASVFSTYLLLMKLCSQRYGGGSLLKAFVLAVVGALVYMASGSLVVMSIALFVAASQGVSLKTLMRVLLWTSVGVLFIGWLCDALGLVSSLYITHGDTLRSSMGFTHPNVHGALVARICTAIVVLRWEKPRATTVAVLLVCVAFVDATSNSRTAEAYIALLALLVVGWGLLRPDRDEAMARRTVKLLGVAIFGSMACAYLVMVFYGTGNGLLAQLNSLLTNRLYYMWAKFEGTGITLFGSSIYEQAGISVYNSATTGGVDNAWGCWLLKFGLVPTVLLAIGLFLLLRAAYRSGKVGGGLVVLAMLLTFYAWGEAATLSIDFNPLLVQLAVALYGQEIAGLDCELGDVRMQQDDRARITAGRLRGRAQRGRSRV